MGHSRIFIQIKSRNKHKSIQLVLMGRILSIYEVMLQEISKMSHFKHKVVRLDVGRRCLIIHMGLQWNMKLSSIQLTTTSWTKSWGGGWSQIYNTGSITPFKCIQVYIHHLMRIVCEWITLKADGRSPEIFLVHFWGMPSSHEFIVSDEMILTKSREIRWSRGNNSIIIGLVMRENMKR